MIVPNERCTKIQFEIQSQQIKAGEEDIAAVLKYNLRFNHNAKQRSVRVELAVLKYNLRFNHNGYRSGSASDRAVLKYNLRFNHNGESVRVAVSSAVLKYNLRFNHNAFLVTSFF